MGLISVDIVLLVGGVKPLWIFYSQGCRKNKLAKLYRRHASWVEKVWATTMSSRPFVRSQRRCQHVHLHVDHHVSHNVGHHDVISTLCEVSETMT